MPYCYYVIPFSITEPDGKVLERLLIHYFFTGEEHPVDLKSHGNSKTSTPYKRQVCSTLEQLKKAAIVKKPKEACRDVENQVGGVDSAPSSSTLPRNRQQAANIRRKLPFSSSSMDPLMAVVDLSRTKHSDFIIAFQLHPTPLCILGTKEQLNEMESNCACADGTVLHIDPTFNLGNYYVTPLVFPLKNYLYKRTGQSPTYVGPLLIHHRMDYESYHTFLSQLVGKRPGLRNIRAIGSDGEGALCTAIEDVLPLAIHLRCFKHLKDNVQRKLVSMQFDSFSQKKLLADIFGTVVDGIHEQGIIDADSNSDFAIKLQSLQTKWNKLELKHRAFKSGETQTPSFHTYFVNQFSEVFKKNAIKEARKQAGLGNPPIAFYNNRSESVNRLLKRHVEGKKCTLPFFIDKMKEMASEQKDMKTKAHIRIGEWRPRATTSMLPSSSATSASMLSPDSTSNPEPPVAEESSCATSPSSLNYNIGPTVSTMSETYEALAQMGTYEDHVLQDIWKKSEKLINTPNFITSVPGDAASSRARMVATFTGKTPHHVSPSHNSQNRFLCDANCPRFKAYKFCSHSIAVAEVNGVLKAYLSILTKGKSPANLSAMVYHGLPTGAGEKGGRSKPKRKRSSAPSLASLPSKQRIVPHTHAGSSPTQSPSPTPCSSRQTTPESVSQQYSYVPTASHQLSTQMHQSSTNVASSNSQPFILKLLTASIKVCAGCRLGYDQCDPPYDICITHHEKRRILNRAMGEMMLVGTNAHYHPRVSCIKLQHPSFCPSELVIPLALRNKLLSNCKYSELIQQEFGITV